MLDVDAHDRLTVHVILPMSFDEQLIDNQCDDKAADSGRQASETSDNGQQPPRSNRRFTSSEYSWSQDLPHLCLRILIFNSDQRSIC